MHEACSPNCEPALLHMMTRTRSCCGGLTLPPPSRLQTQGEPMRQILKLVAFCMGFEPLLAGFIVGVWAAAANAATFELARRADGIVVQGIKVEGAIVPGDAQKLLDFYRQYGDMIYPVYLRSKGGDVTEAMRMGAIIRRLRLETSVPVWDTGSAPIDPIRIDHQENMICASACFLVYAG